MVAITSMRIDPETKTYVERRRAEGRTDREIRRCLKRYLARQVRYLNAVARETMLEASEPQLEDQPDSGQRSSDAHVFAPRWPTASPGRTHNTPKPQLDKTLNIGEST